MSLVAWSEDLTIGSAAVDNDHRKLFSLVNYLYDSMVLGRNEPDVEEFVDSLIVYARQHFQLEEDIFDKTQFPDKDLHKKEHEDLIDQLRDVVIKYKSGASTSQILEMIGFLNKWMIEHIRKSDMKYAPYLKGRENS
jgi:hemerythrin